MGRYDKLDVLALRVMCKDNGLRINGKKNELIRRLEEYHEKDYNSSGDNEHNIRKMNKRMLDLERTIAQLREASVNEAVVPVLSSTPQKIITQCEGMPMPSGLFHNQMTQGPSVSRGEYYQPAVSRREYYQPALSRGEYYQPPVTRPEYYQPAMTDYIPRGATTQAVADEEVVDEEEEEERERCTVEEEVENHLKLRVDRLENEVDVLRERAERADRLEIEVDVLRERAERADRLEIEVQKFKEKLADAEELRKTLDQKQNMISLYQRERSILEKETYRCEMEIARKEKDYLEKQLTQAKRKIEDESLKSENVKEKHDDIALAFKILYTQNTEEEEVVTDQVDEGVADEENESETETETSPIIKDIVAELIITTSTESLDNEDKEKSENTELGNIITEDFFEELFAEANAVQNDNRDEDSSIAVSDYFEVKHKFKDKIKRWFASFPDLDDGTDVDPIDDNGSFEDEV